jgi:hypothetical protein
MPGAMPRRKFVRAMPIRPWCPPLSSASRQPGGALSLVSPLQCGALARRKVVIDGPSGGSCADRLGLKWFATGTF